MLVLCFTKVNLHNQIFSVLPSFIALCISRVAIASPADPVYVASKKMRDLRVNSAVIMTGSKILGILT